MNSRRRRWVASLLGLAMAPVAGLTQQVLPAPLAAGPPSEVPVAVQILRWHMLDNDVSSLMFRSMDTLFTTRSVARSTTPRSSSSSARRGFGMETAAGLTPAVNR